VNISSGGQTPIVLSVASATNALSPFGAASDVRPCAPTAPALNVSRLRGIALWLLMLCGLVIAWAAATRRRLPRGVRFAQTGALAILLSIGLATCFGSGTSTTPPTGTYTMTVAGTITGTGGSTTGSLQVTLIVQ
jgi:hypothetical protein